jgi:nicotinamide-nucleotide amidase
VHEIGTGESDAVQRLGDIMQRDRNPLVGTTVSDAVVTARIRAEGPRKWAAAQVEETIRQIEQRWHPYCFGRDAMTLAHAVGSLLKSGRRTLAVAESCTGGWLGKMIVDVAGSSDYFLGGWITYTNELKTSELGVPPEVIGAHGAVSAEVAQAMASGALRRASADFALAITGVAGPDGGSDAKPVGTVFIGLASLVAGKVRTSSRRFLFTGDRTMNRDRSAKSALQMLRFELLGPDDAPLLWEDIANANNPKSQHANIEAQAVQ